MDESGGRLDLTSDAVDPKVRDGESGAGRFLGVNFECCGVYGRIYPNPAGDAYEGRCPKCMATVRVGIGPEGSSSRFFTAR